MIALFSFRQPWLRVLGGIALCLEVFGLKIVMRLWNWGWFALALYFIDWDRLFSRLFRPQAALSPEVPRYPTRWVSFSAGYAALFLFVNLVIAFEIGGIVDTRLNSFPFTKYGMHSTILAVEPYSSNVAVHVEGPYWEIDTVGVAPEAVDRLRRTLQRSSFPLLAYVYMPERLATAIVPFHRWIREALGEKHVRQVRFYHAYYELVPPPAPPGVRISEQRLIARIDHQGKIETRSTLSSLR